jgi:hypothetical protein
MALFTDGPATSIAALREYESSILDVAATEGIDLTVKLTVAHRETGIDLERFLTEHGGAALDNVVVTSPLKAWETFRTLVVTFRDAYHSQMNDRYEPKWKEYERRARWAEDALFQLGVGITWSPVAKANPPAVTVGAGAVVAATYYFRVSWRGANGEEGAPSEISVASASDASAVTVDAGPLPPGVMSWNAGHSACEATLQNDASLGAGETWSVPAGGLANGRAVGTGQAPQAMLKRFQRV